MPALDSGDTLWCILKLYQNPALIIFGLKDTINSINTVNQYGFQAIGKKFNL